MFRMNKKIPKEQFPEPQFQRSRWQNLNGNWQFEIDYGISGFDRCFFKHESLNGNIVVPFCPESKLSGVEQEENGLYLYDRTPKADIDFIRKVNIQPAAIEQEGEN